MYFFFRSGERGLRGLRRDEEGRAGGGIIMRKMKKRPDLEVIRVL